MDNFQHLETVYQEHQNDEQIIMRNLNDGADTAFGVGFLEGTYVARAVYWFYMHEDVGNSKSNFFKAARVAEYLTTKFDRRMMDSGINRISYALLSDNPELIARYSTLRNSKNHELNIGFQIPNAIQNVLLNNNDALEANIRNLERFVQVRRFTWWSPLVEVFKGFRLQDPRIIETALQQMIKTHNKRNTMPLISKFLSEDTAGLCKLAWIKGFEIDLKNSLVPLELMEVKPLSHYDESNVLIELGL